MSQIDIAFFQKPVNANIQDEIPAVFRADTKDEGVLHARELYKQHLERRASASDDAQEAA